MKKLLPILLILPFLIGAAPTRTNNFISGTTIRSEEVNTDFNDLFGYLQTGVDTIRTDGIDSITEFNSSIKSGSDATIITGTKGDEGEFGYFNSDGDLVEVDGMVWTPAISTVTISNGTWSSQTAYIKGLISCDTIDTDADGLLSCGTDDGGSGSGDAVTVNSTAVDTTANLLDGDIDFSLVDGGAGGPDDITATVACTGCIDATDMAANSVDSSELVDGSIDKSHLAVSTDFGDVSTDGSSNVTLDSGVVDSTAIADNTIQAVDFEATNAESDNDIVTYDSATGGFTFSSCAEVTGSADLCDGSDDGGGGGDSITVAGTAATNANFIAGTNIVIGLDTAATPDDILITGTGIATTEMDTYSEINAIVSDVTLTSNDLIDTYSELNTIVSDVTLTHNGLIDTSSELITIVGDETGSGALVFGTSPTFTTSIVMGSADLNEAELEIIDGLTSTTAELESLTDGSEVSIHSHYVDTGLTTVDIDTLSELNSIVSDSTLVDLDDSNTLTNKTMDSDNNTFSNIAISETKLVAGTNITLSTDTLNVDDAFLINDGDDSSSGGLTITGIVVSTQMQASNLVSCDTIDTDASGIFSCGTDSSGSGGGDFVWYLRPQQAKLPSSNPMAIDGGNNLWRGLFDDTTSESAQWTTVLQPLTGTLKAKIFYTTAATSGTAAFDIEIDCHSDSDTDPDTQSFGTADGITGTVDGTAEDLDILSDASLNGDSCAEGDLITVKLSRDVAADSVTGDLEFRGAIIYAE